MMLKRLLKRDEQGAGAVEFALALPALITFIIGTTQLGALFFADADLRHAVAAGARVASVWPVPDDETIKAKIEEKIVRLDDASTSEPTITRGTDENGNAFLEITMTHAIPLDFVFFQIGPVTLTETRRVFTQVSAPLEQGDPGEGEGEGEGDGDGDGEGGTSSAGGGTSSTTSTSSGTSSDGSSSWGGTSTSASTSGGTSSTTSGGTSSTTSGGTTTTTSSSGNSNGNSSGNSNGNSNGGNGHGHGNCNKNC